MAYDINIAKELVIKAGLELSESGLIARTWGNISARISDKEFVITPSGRGYDTLTPDDLVVINMDDLSYEGDIKPSSEKGVHAAAYKIHKKINFVIHTHQENASAISILGAKTIDISTVDEEASKVIGPRIATAKYGLSSTKKLTSNVADAMGFNQDTKAILMKNHGALCLGTDYEDAFNVAHALETVSGKIFEEYCGEMHRCEEASYKVVYTDEKGGTLLHITSPYTVKMSQLGKKLPSYIDDFAQMVGTGASCLPRTILENDIVKKLEKTPIVMVKGKGAYTWGTSFDEAEACAMVLEKNAKAACLGMITSKSPVDSISALIEHGIYVKKYSKLK